MTLREGSYVRWQGIALKQLTYAVNLILGFTVATLGFGVTLLRDQQFSLSARARYALVVSLLGLLLSVIAGLWCVVNRLRDFRLTALIARLREENAADTRLSVMRDTAANLGRCTWKLFWWQAILFAGGVVLMISSIALAYWTKLF